ncbi:hypothetical protein B0H19DRAFT_1329365 [Mycena capillaripes]|nr:hypothetical protein B0H19DRAFT_1329365 [Mycena capillaripes]
MCNYLDWGLAVNNPILGNFEAMVQRDFSPGSKGPYLVYLHMGVEDTGTSKQVINAMVDDLGHFATEMTCKGEETGGGRRVERGEKEESKSKSEGERMREPDARLGVCKDEPDGRARGYPEHRSGDGGGGFEVTLKAVMGEKGGA